MPKSVYPFNVERDYLRDILKIFSKWSQELLENISSRLDNFFSNIFESFRNKWVKISEKFSTKIHKAGINTANYQKNILYSQITNENQVSAINIFKSEKWLESELIDFTNENVRLIKSVGIDTANKIETLVTDGVKQGKRANVLKKEIQEVFLVSESRASLIAVDQIGKMNGIITKLRQEKLGIKSYIWRSVGDERVRATHKAFNGQKFSWDKGSPEGHPGQPIRCRCFAEPIFEEL